MNKHRKFQTAASLGAGLLLLAAALTAWGITVKLQDGATSITCTTTDNTTIAPNGDITVPVAAGCLPTGDGGGDPPPPGSFTLSVSKNGTGSGTVNSSPAGISCGGDCSEIYSDGTPVSLTATPAAGSTFGGWAGACSGTGTCSLSMTANLSVTASFTADGGGGDCGPLPADVIPNPPLDTGNLNTAWSRTSVLRPGPTNIYAFKVTVPSGFTGRSNFTATRDSQALKAKALVVSTCPGVLTPVGGQSSCVKENGTDEALIPLSANPGDSSFFCKLSPGVYYVNAVSKNRLSDNGFNCTTSVNCGFFASRSAPY